MKKYTQLTILIGILFCNIPLLQASSDDNGPYSPAKIVPYAIGIVSAFVINTTANICSQAFQTYLKQTQAQAELAKESRSKSISYAQLAQNGYITRSSDNLPETVKEILSSEKQSFHTEAKIHVHFDQTNEEDGELFAQKIAFQSHGNYYKVEKNPLDPQVNLKDLQAKVSHIAGQATSNQPAIIYMNFNQDELNASVYPQEATKAHNLYKGTLAQALKELSTQHPNVRIVTNSAAQQATKKSSRHSETNSYYDPTRLLKNVITFNAPKVKVAQPKDYALIQPSNITPEELSLYIAYTLKKEDAIQAQNQKSSSWFWNRPFMSTSTTGYKVSTKSHVNSYFNDTTHNLSNEQIKKAVKQARKTQLTNQSTNSNATTLFEQFYSLFQPQKAIEITQFDILAEITNKNNTNNQSSKKPDFTEKFYIDNLFAAIPVIPTRIPSKKEPVQLKRRLGNNPTSTFCSQKYSDKERATWTTQEFIQSIKSSDDFQQGQSLIIEEDKAGVLEFQKRKAEEKQAHENFMQKLALIRAKNKDNNSKK